MAIAKSLGQMMAEGWTHRAIAERVGRSPGWVADRVAELRGELEQLSQRSQP